MNKLQQKIKVLAFGMVADKIQTSVIEIDGISSTDVLKGYLFQQFPGLEEIRFSISVNRKQAVGNQPIPPGAEVALLPPFSGG